MATRGSIADDPTIGLAEELLALAIQNEETKPGYFETQMDALNEGVSMIRFPSSSSKENYKPDTLKNNVITTGLEVKRGLLTGKPIPENVSEEVNAVFENFELPPTNDSEEAVDTLATYFLEKHWRSIGPWGHTKSIDDHSAKLVTTTITFICSTNRPSSNYNCFGSGAPCRWLHRASTERPWPR